MHAEVKRLADGGDIKGLRYIFADALDMDPTFIRYQEDYEYCRSKGLLEPHQELTPLTQDKTQWTKEYWVQLKTDLLKNLSEKRLMHMKQVAQVLKADKIRRLTEERRQAAEAARLQEERKQMEEAARRKAEEAAQATRKKEKVHSEEPVCPKTVAAHTQAQPAPGSEAEREKQRVAAIRAQLARENAARVQSEEKARAETEEANAKARRKTESKKVIWVAVAAAILVVMIAVILVVVSNPGNAAAVLRAGAAFGSMAITTIGF